MLRKEVNDAEAPGATVLASVAGLKLENILTEAVLLVVGAVAPPEGVGKADELE